MNAAPNLTLKNSFILIILASSSFIVLTYFISMGLGLLVLFSTSGGLSFSRETLEIPLLDLPILSVPVNAGLYFVFLWWVFAVCFAAAWKYRESFTDKFREFSSGKSIRNLFTNNLLTMPVITSMLLVFILILNYFQTAAGISTGELPQADPFLDFVAVSRAPLVEELLFRIVPLGAFLVSYVYFAGIRLKPELSTSQRARVCLLAVLQPEKAKEKIGLKTISQRGLLHGIDWGEWLIIALTSSLFGLAHLLGGGWLPGKVSQAAISGAVFAVAYLYYGIQAPILMHWYFNFYYTALDLGFIYYSSQIDFLSLAWSANLIFGTFMLVLMTIIGVILGVRALTKGLRKSQTMPVPEPPS